MRYPNRIAILLLAAAVLVDDTTFASMPPKSEEPSETGAAIEWFVRSLAGHPGGAPGQNIGFQLAPDDHLGVTVLANWGTEPDAYPAWTSAADALYAMLGISLQ
jgi:hypothetical protein